MYYIISLLNHLKRVHAWASETGGSATVDARDLSLEVTLASQCLRLRPQFTVWWQGRRLYTSTFSANVQGFIGWRPHAPRHWAATAEKLVFKQFARAGGVLTPDWWSEPSANIRQFIIKRNRSSFGYGIRGPFETLEPGNPLHALDAGEYYEAFVPGRIAKAWYLDGELLCLEVRPPPFVTGDGRTTLLDLAAKRHISVVDEQSLSWIVASQGRRLSDVLPEGQRVVVDYKYGSPMGGWSFDNENLLATLRDGKIGEQFSQAGSVLLGVVPPDMRHSTVITLDAVVDADDIVWFLEMNSNPMVHPDTYDKILRQAFDIDPAAVAAQ